jgi:hypothetical protein
MKLSARLDLMLTRNSSRILNVLVGILHKLKVAITLLKPILYYTRNS